MARKRKDDVAPAMYRHFLSIVLIMFALVAIYIMLLYSEQRHCIKLDKGMRQLVVYARRILDQYSQEEWVKELQHGDIDLDDTQVKSAIDRLVLSFRKYTARKEGSETVAESRSSLTEQNEFDLSVFLKEYDKTFNNYYLMTSHNPYGVNFSGTIYNESRDSQDLLCDLKRRAKYDVLKRDTTPFKEIGISKYFPEISLYEKFKGFESCAIVASAAYFKNATLGKEIDSHDAVLRFNDAPTEGFEENVGRKTTIRLMNTLIFEEERFGFETKDIFRNITLLVWKSGPYNGNLYRFYSLYKDSKPFFDKYIQWREAHPWESFYIMDPTPIWRTWDIIQENTPNITIRKTLPSSGIMGISLMQRMCDTVNVYGYLIPNGDPPLCHYYDGMCSKATWHPVEYEKKLVRHINFGSTDDILKHGRMTVPGFRTFHCD
ncbi:beta-galactoside alpha-2,6-sialyltransferase 1-like [Saccoglossus kowalevskii]|uniref:beta-galactoside alpha-(2,6)-sialyltransferase n=2 Tax=Saccoglossus kowalevskii TaxID=10224 RepID=A0ABM0MCH9_SACKO|nr:PREDICTED: beta-galactoside alpha-2,6-sialyltransferase 2-like [Saccoglossus kowalevskii]